MEKDCGVTQLIRFRWPKDTFSFRFLELIYKLVAAFMYVQYNVKEGTINVFHSMLGYGMIYTKASMVGGKHINRSYTQIEF